jgi:hypothetical protein
MAIPIEHEDVKDLKKWGMGLDKLVEECHFCGTKTRYWHNRTNTPVCEGCAKTNTVADIKRSNVELRGGPAVSSPERPA